MPELSVKRGQSLWSIAERVAKQTHPTPSDNDILTIKNAIAAANGLSPEAQLRIGQTITIPDALARLSTTPNPQASAVNTRARDRARPLVDWQPHLVETPLKRGDKVALPDVAGVKLDATLVHHQGTASYIGETAQIGVDARFGKLTQEQFNAIHAELGGRSHVKFDPAREYALMDFLPPLIQALVGKDLEIPEPIELKGSKKVIPEEDFGREILNDHKVDFTMNCHATAWEAMRAYQSDLKELSVFYGEMITMDGLCSEENVFAKVHELEKGKVNDLASLDLKPGDVVQLFQDNDFMRASTNILHSAVYVGGGLFFEKPNTEGPEKNDPANYVSQDETPWRLATAEHVIKPVSDALDGQIRLEVKRAKAPLPDAHKAFGSSYQESFEKWAQKKGRELGVDLVSSFEQGMGGNIISAGISALIRTPIAVGEDGRGKLV